MLYLLDANVLITLSNELYAFDIVPQFWEWLLFQAESNIIKLPHEILEEITSGTQQNDTLKKWVREHRDVLLLKENNYLEVVPYVVNRGYAPDLNDIELATIGRDPFLIAAARILDEACVVTFESSKPGKIRQNRKIPDVCADLQVPCMNPIQFVRLLGFTANWHR